ncbi:MAG: hypothetical protein RLZZ312_1991 [Bacteroidota bacterium]|jgi:hypothetical protein
MKNFSKFALSAILVAGFAFTSCSKDDEPTPVVKASIYDRLGGSVMVQDPDAAAGVMIEKGRLSYRTVVNKTIGKIVADITANNAGNLSSHFAPILAETGATQQASVAALSDSLTDFFSFNTGGTNAVNTYTGRTMAAAHNPAMYARMGAKSSNTHYDRFVGFVGASANEAGVASNTELYTDIVAVLQSLRGAIVQI